MSVYIILLCVFTVASHITHQEWWITQALLIGVVVTGALMEYKRKTNE